MSITVYLDSMYVQNVKTVLLFISPRSCLFSDIDASGAWPNKVVSILNCLPPLSRVGKFQGQSDSAGRKNTKLTVDHKFMSQPT